MWNYANEFLLRYIYYKKNVIIYYVVIKNQYNYDVLKMRYNVLFYILLTMKLFLLIIFEKFITD